MIMGVQCEHREKKSTIDHFGSYKRNVTYRSAVIFSLNTFSGRTGVERESLTLARVSPSVLGANIARSAVSGAALTVPFTLTFPWEAVGIVLGVRMTAA